ncbi:signal peptidase II [Candidatus Cytomitobacter indipagum]|nr:signal peptidase II [Candidatus Cytomitobacter indipagum]
MISKSFLTLFIVFADQMTKKFALQYSFKYGIYSLTSFLKILIKWNYGLSFSVCDSFHTRVLQFVMLSACILLSSMWHKAKIKSETIAYSLILGGGIGNLIDRIWHGAVLDFIYIHMKGFSFPVFNIADISITVGIMMIIWNNIMYKKR